MAKKKTLPSEVVSSEAYVKDFFDMVVPSTIKFNVDHFVCGDSFRCVWAIKEYPPNTTDQAILSRFGDKEAVTLHMYTRFVDGLEQRSATPIIAKGVVYPLQNGRASKSATHGFASKSALHHLRLSRDE